MKLLKRNTIFSFYMLLAVVLSASNAFSAATGFSDDAGSPMGLAIQGAAPGEKLTGVMCLELFPNSSGSYDGYAVVRLRKSNQLEAYYAEIFGVPITEPLPAQEAIMAAIGPDIKKDFFDDDQTVELVLRNVEEWVSVDGDTIQHGPFDYTVVDVVIAGK